MLQKLLTIALLGAALLAYGQKGGKKPAKDYTSPSVMSIDQAQQRPQNEGPALLKEQLGLRPQDEMRLQSSDSDELGFTHQKYQHYHNGIKVFGSVYTVHSKDGSISHLSGKYSKIENVTTRPSLSHDQALEKAILSIGARSYSWEQDATQQPSSELVIMDAATTGDEARLAYHFEIIAINPYQRYEVYIDAITGATLMQYSKIHFADAVGSAATRYSGTQSIHTDSFAGGYRLRDLTRGSGIDTWDATTATGYNATTGAPTGSSDYVDNDNNWTAAEYNNTDKDNAGLEAHFGAEATYDFFNTTFGRNSYNGSGATINSYVNTNIESVYGYPAGYNDNAFWTGYVMVYGKGGSYDPLTTVDITGHEIGHAFMEYTANLVYEKESGAMNESFSDIWGTCVENYTNLTYGTTKDLWNLGSEIGATFRSMSNPNAYSQPDTYGGTYWINVTSCTPSSANDNCGVHTNSGVGNHWFYILSVGKSGTNDLGNSFSVTGIGLDKAAAISWRTQSVYLSTTSTYANWRTFSIQSARELYGADSNEEIAVTNAWYAVGVGAAYSAPAACVASPLALSITFDNYPEETSWNIKNSGGTTVASGGTYGSQPDGSTLNLSIPLAAGDYTFTILDSYGDGICCSYGNGSYTLSSGATVLATGGSFTSSQSAGFCIEAIAPDTQAPSVPTGLTASSLTQTSFTLSWTASTDNVGVTGYDIYKNGAFLISTGSTTASISGLTASTSYSFTVRAKDAAGNVSVSSSPLNVTTLSPVVTYCTASGNNASYEWIDLVKLGTINNVTGTNGGYGNYTALSTTLVRGTANTIYISAGFSGSSYTENWRIWIDYNQDGDFLDAGEQIVSGTTSSGATFNAGFTVPASASLGATRMRVAMVWNATPASCGTFSYGEVEDYTVSISSTALARAESAVTLPGETLKEGLSFASFGIYPNPASDQVNLVLGELQTATTIRVYDIGGRLSKTIENYDGRALNVSDLKPGLYIVQIQSEKGSHETRFIKE